MHALHASALPVFRVPKPSFWGLKVTCAWLTRIGRRLAVLHGRQPASASYWKNWPYARGLINLVDFVTIFPYRHPEGQQTTGAWYVTGGHARLPAACVPTEVTWAGASTPVPSRDSLPHGSVPAPVHFREIHFECSPFTSAKVRRRLRTTRWTSEAVPPPLVAREYSAGCELVPFLVQMISPFFCIVHRTVLTLSLSICTVGKCWVRARSTSRAVNRSTLIAPTAALMVSLIDLYPVACVSIVPREAFTAWSNSRFFWTRLVINSASRSSLAISAASLARKLTNSGCIVDELIALTTYVTRRPREAQEESDEQKHILWGTIKEQL
jgi:hypothetical protein